MKNWSLRNLKDTRENLITQVSGTQSIPDAAKAMIVEAITNHDSPANLLRVDAYLQVVKTKSGTKAMYDLDISDL